MLPLSGRFLALGGAVSSPRTTPSLFRRALRLILRRIIHGR